MMTPTEARNVAEIRETIGTGPVRPTRQAAKVKKRVVGPREMQAKKEREEAQSLCQRQP